MKSSFTKWLTVFVIFGLFSFAGCSSTPVPYSLTNDESNSASISFMDKKEPTVSFLYYNNNVLPPSESKTYWDPIMFPSGVPLEITVHAYYHPETNTGGAGLLVSLVATAITAKTLAARSVDIDVLYYCPPLEAGKQYTLAFRKESGDPGINRLILTDTATKTIVHQQVFEMR